MSEARSHGDPVGGDTLPRILRIVVGVELGPELDPIIDPAVELATALGATLHVVHGYMMSDPLLDAYSRSGYLGVEALEDHGRELQRRLEPRVAELGDQIRAHAHVVAGPAAMAIVETAREVEADLIIVGASHRARLPRAVLGSTARAVLRRTTTPVLMMRADMPALPTRVLAPTDIGPGSEAAHGWGVAVAIGTARAVLIRSLLVINQSLMLLPLERRLLEDVAKAELEEFTRKVAVLGEASERKIRVGDPTEEILAEATEWMAELIVMGTEGRRGMERLFLGSVAESVLKSARCNVLLVPDAGTRTE